MSAAAALARAEAAGLRLRLSPDGQVEMQAPASLPPGVVEDLRRWRADVAHLLATRDAVAAQAAGVQGKPAGERMSGGWRGGGGWRLSPGFPHTRARVRARVGEAWNSPSPPPPLHPPTGRPPADWLAGITRSIRAALGDGAVAVADEAGFLTLVRPDGRRTVVAPHIVAELAQAGLLPPLPDALTEPAADDPVERAEREAIENEPPLPSEGTPARACLDDEQAALLRGLREAALQRPPCFPGEADRPPPQGARCSACKGRWWWFPRHPATDATGPSGDWRCPACRPPVHAQKDQIVRVET